MLIQERTCRACQTPLETVLNLGMLALSAFPTGAEVLPKAPLDFCRCPACGLVQMRHTVAPDALFRQYWYRSGVNETMRAELANIVDGVIKLLGKWDNTTTVVDVGANDGTLLSLYPRGLFRVAYEPADNLQALLASHCDALYPGYFPDAHVLEPASIDVLTSIACFYAVDDPVAFVRAVDGALSPQGLWIVQFQDLHQMLEATAFDDICHEHLFCPSLASIERLLTPFDLVIIDAEQRLINGGSLRLTIGRRWRSVSPRVAMLRLKEVVCESVTTLQAFAHRVGEARTKIRDVVSRSRTVDLYGASTKGNTLLQICGLGPKLIRQAWERSPEKIGRQTVTSIPIVSESAGRADPPDMLLVGIWQFRDAVIQREAAYLEAGGRLLFPLPRVEVVSRGYDDVYKSVRARTHTSAAR